jgi:hypothetical protein
MRQIIRSLRGFDRCVCRDAPRRTPAPPGQSCQDPAAYVVTRDVSTPHPAEQNSHP